MSGLFDLSGRVALVTGGASGIGVGICEVLSKAGARVVIADRDEAGAMAQVAAGAAIGFVPIDLMDEASIVAGCARVIAEHGVPWALVNNAGLQHREMLLEGTAAHWERINAVNARGPYFLIREIARAMAAQAEAGPEGRGRIVNCASSGLVGQFVQGLSAYMASKGALAAMTTTAAFELAGYGITVNTVLPGGVGTPGSIGAEGPPPIGPGNRKPPLGYCTPRDIATAVLYFATPAARLVTNQVLCVDGGFTVT
ncbi:SDR family NAD(P)-dependent oxidoreductase [Novosphingobium album (ex Liu et al. 2023)]|uniref:SDR family NAD(P)-dependent oxidoreductase n=1 Tax=Novosphingobium album (ex Liu et al. 2023) TaxID=3031130 RepID=A0ABT5WTB0_9SPHN|nr:SDR family oxidoreductase [Novosphingobium album (ex Liu et al. 2023)]MDE8652588.1 SDR family NAD(P)-dependent oxidoreductase [Novosphingobium album (ex Liu et al. 2023)]